jgi:4-amino-4-deoxy-L-arabinose transferase-like glycosyltransferase
VTNNSSDIKLHSRSQILKSPIFIVSIALLFRIFLVVLLHHNLLNPADDHFRFGWETGRVARSVASGKGFSSPYGGETGPTAAQAPLYIYLLAGIFKLFGIYSRTSAIVILILDSVFSSLTCWTIYLLARDMIGETAALWCGWIWAFLPSAWYISAKVVWETTLTTFLLSVLVLLALRLKPASSLWHQFGFGCLCGLTALSSPVVVIVLPFIVLWPAIRFWPAMRQFLLPLGAAILGFLLILTPWFVRNIYVFHQFVPFRTNLGLELQIGNNPLANGAQVFELHPAHSVVEWEKYRQMGELAYMAQKKSDALQFISMYPGKFFLVTMWRVALWWSEGPAISGGAGLLKTESIEEFAGYGAMSILATLGLFFSVRNGKKGALLFAILLLLYPLPYYVTLVHFRYRHPLEPFLVILAVLALQEIFSRKRAHPALSKKETSGAGSSSSEPKVNVECPA